MWGDEGGKCFFEAVFTEGFLILGLNGVCIIVSIFFVNKIIILTKIYLIAVNNLSVPNKVVEYVREKGTVSIQDIMQKFDVSRTTSRNYLSRLAGTDFVKRVGRGIYQLDQKTPSRLEVSDEIVQISRWVKNRFPMVKFVIWSLNLLNDFTHYSIGKNIVFIETDEMLSTSIRDVLTEKGYFAVLNPEKKDFEEYTYYGERVAFILERKEKYALQEIDTLMIPTLERMWLDIYYLTTRKDFTFPLQELGVIFGNMLNGYGINFDRLLRYASRRGVRDEIIIFLYTLRESHDLSIPEHILVGRKNGVKTIKSIAEGVEK